MDSVLQKVLNTGIALGTERDRNKLLDLIISSAIEIANCDAGTLYLYDDKERCLRFKIMRNNTMNSYQGGDGEQVELPPVPLKHDSVCSYAALLRKCVNIPDVYHCSEFDFSGPKRYDSMTGYLTRSMLVVPFENTRGEIIGVLQLINALDEIGAITSFLPEHEQIIAALASQAAIAITNTLYLDDIKQLFNSFVQVMISAIDQMSPYNVHHTQKIADYASRLVDYINEQHRLTGEGDYYDENRREQFLMACWMHDIGKLVTPPEVMNKVTRLEGGLHDLLLRLDIDAAMARMRWLEGKLDEPAYLQICELADQRKAFFTRINSTGFLCDADAAQLEALRDQQYTTLEGQQQPLLSSLEYDCLAVRKGNLTAAERQIMQNHVSLTAKLLSNIQFGKGMENIPIFAAMHHEYLDGSGYPLGLHADQLPTEARLLSIIDIYEALTSSDRPYKVAMASADAFGVLDSMVQQGKLDGALVALFRASMI